MNATYTAQDIEIASAAMKLSVANLTIGQRMKLGKVDYPAISREFLDFVTKPRMTRDYRSEKALFAGTSEQFKVLRKFGLITIEIS